MALVLSWAFLYGFHVTYFASELCYRCSSKISNFFSLGVPRDSKSPAVTTYASVPVLMTCVQNVGYLLLIHVLLFEGVSLKADYIVPLTENGKNNHY